MYLGYYGWLIDGNKANDYNSQDLCLPLRLLLPEDFRLTASKIGKRIKNGQDMYPKHTAVLASIEMEYTQ